jgi:hypothetical protein
MLLADTKPPAYGMNNSEDLLPSNARIAAFLNNSCPFAGRCVITVAFTESDPYLENTMFQLPDFSMSL